MMSSPSGKHAFVHAPVEVVGEGLGLIGEVRSTDTLEEHGVTGEDGRVPEVVHRRALGVTGHADRRNGQLHAGRQGDAATVAERLEVEREVVRGIQPQVGARRGDQVSRAAEVIGVKVRIEHVRDRPAVRGGGGPVLLDLE